MEKEKTVNVYDYYNDLTKKEKGKFLSYLMIKYGMNYNTMLKKFRMREQYPFRSVELMAVKEAINEELWKAA